MLQPINDNFTPSKDDTPRLASLKQDATHPEQVAHELANLLDGSLRHMNSTINQVQHLPAGKIDSTILDQLETINNAMQQMIELVHGIGQKKNEHSNCLPNEKKNLQSTIYESIQLNKPRLEALNIQYDINIVPQAKLLPTGPLMIVFNNAIINSIQAIEKSGTRDGYIAIKVITDTKYTCIQITDNGCGIDPLLIDPINHFIFGITTKIDGNGIGLAYCKEIAKTLDGSIELQNVLPHGSRLTFKYATQKI